MGRRGVVAGVGMIPFTTPRQDPAIRRHGRDRRPQSHLDYDRVQQAAGVSPGDIRVVEPHDCFTTNELLTYVGPRLTPEGTAEKFIADGDNTYGGKAVTNPSGGLLSKGHPLGATGLAQCAELVWQLRGQARARQVEGVELALRFVLHGEQSFTYHSLAYPGDVLTTTPRLTDVYSKKGGALEFIVKETAVTRPDGSAVADLKAVVVVRNPGAGE